MLLWPWSLLSTMSWTKYFNEHFTYFQHTVVFNINFLMNIVCHWHSQVVMCNSSFTLATILNHTALVGALYELYIRICVWIALIIIWLPNSALLLHLVLNLPLHACTGPEKSLHLRGGSKCQDAGLSAVWWPSSGCLLSIDLIERCGWGGADDAAQGPTWKTKSLTPCLNPTASRLC